MENRKTGSRVLQSFMGAAFAQDRDDLAAVGISESDMHRPRAAIPVGEVMGVVATSVIFFCVLAVYLGQDASWDLKNYHFYNPFALLSGRLFWDVQPAMRQTYFNPLLDLPFYLFAANASPMVASLALAAFQSLTLVLTYFIVRYLLRYDGWSRTATVLIAAILAVAGALAPLNVYETGMTAGDNTSGVFMLGALLCCLVFVGFNRKLDSDTRRLWLVVAAGLLAGAGTGLKLTNAPYAVALLAALWLVGLPWRTWRNVTLAYGLGGLAGIGVTAGFWWWMLYVEMGNPLFPQMNHIFESPYIDPAPFTDDNYKGNGVAGKLFYPFIYNDLVGGSINGQRFMDVRLPILYILGVVYLSTTFWRRFSRKSAGRFSECHVPHAYMIHFVIIAYVVWLLVFSIDRYALLLEVLTPAVAYATFVSAGLRKQHVVLGVAAVVVVLGITHQWDRSGRRAWSDDLFGVSLPATYDFSDALVVMASHEPITYIIPSFPQSTRFIRITGNLFYGLGHRTLEERYSNRMGDALKRAIDTHTGNLYVVTLEGEQEKVKPEVSHFGLELDATDYGIIVSEINGDPIRVYRASRVASAGD